MKLSSHNSKITLAGLLSVMFVFLSVAAAHAQILLTIDISNPNDVVISATGESASGTTGPIPIPYGIDLLNLFTDDVLPSDPYPFALSSTLTATETSSAYVLDQYGSDNFTTSGADHHDLSLLYNSVPYSNTISFTSGVQAFTGSLTLDLAGYPLYSVGHEGDIIAGFYGSASSDPLVDNTIIGEYIITPEPATWSLLLASLGLLAFFRRCSSRA